MVDRALRDSPTVTYLLQSLKQVWCAGCVCWHEVADMRLCVAAAGSKCAHSWGGRCSRMCVSVCLDTHGTPWRGSWRHRGRVFVCAGMGREADTVQGQT
jgi:hypothetical protein